MMITTIPCPNCNQPIDPQIRLCTHCGVNLAIAAVLAENYITPMVALASDMPMTPEILVPRLGEYLVENGFLETEGLQRALEYQQDQAKTGHPVLLGQALIELELIDGQTLDQAVTEQIFQLQDALRTSNQQLEHRVQERTAELRNALTKLTELNQLKSNFVANISHELRTPLAHMIGYLELISDGSLGPLTSEQTHAISVLKKSYHRLQSLIDNLLQFSLVSQSDMSLHLEPVSIQSLFQRALSRAQSKAQGQKINLKVIVPPDPPNVQADGEKIAWVLEQLLDNSIKFNSSDGKVSLSAKVVDTNVVIAVSDTGVGIPEEKIGEIFEDFHQLDGTTTRKHGGTGLGLSLVQRILDAHGTEVKVLSKVGEGSHFEFQLPISY